MKRNVYVLLKNINLDIVAYHATKNVVCVMEGQKKIVLRVMKIIICMVIHAIVNAQKLMSGLIRILINVNIV